MSRKNGRSPIVPGRSRSDEMWANSSRIRGHRPRRSWLILVAIAAAIALMFVALDDARACGSVPPPSPAKLAELPTEYPHFYRALRVHFKAHWREAAIVSWKEGSWHWWARNGQFLGTFQMGSSERARFGHGDTLVEQVAAAARYFWQSYRERGLRWVPWECKPWAY